MVGPADQKWGQNLYSTYTQAAGKSEYAMQSDAENPMFFGAIKGATTYTPTYTQDAPTHGLHETGLDSHPNFHRKKRGFNEAEGARTLNLRIDSQQVILRKYLSLRQLGKMLFPVLVRLLVHFWADFGPMLARLRTVSI